MLTGKEIEMSEIVFVDVDGTLSVPIYKKNGADVIGFSPEEWLKYCIQNGEDTYQYCKPVAAVKKYAQKRKREGAVLYVLTTSKTSFETKAKEKFTERYYPGLFEEIIAVASDEMKLPVMLSVAEKYGVRPEKCELVEDTFSTLLQIMQSGIRPVHISHLLADPLCTEVLP